MKVCVIVLGIFKLYGRCFVLYMIFCYLGQGFWSNHSYWLSTFVKEEVLVCEVIVLT